ncbi:MAG: zinc metallopeptidase [Bacteroidota bacterium]
MLPYLILVLLPIAASYFIGWRFKAKAKQYAESFLQNGLTGAQIAERMLHDHGIYDVKVLSVEGQLTDHYNPANKTVNLSQVVYHSNSVLAAAVAAHECGHAVQHAKAYSWLMLRSKVVPVVSITSQFIPFVLMGGVLMINIFPQLLLLGIVIFALSTLFSIITLPVEFDASKRALAWLNTKGYVVGREANEAKTALNWAASTYVMNAIASIGTLMYYVLLFTGRRD